MMKKIFILLVTVLVMTFVSCSTDGGSGDGEVENTSTNLSGSSVSTGSSGSSVSTGSSGSSVSTGSSVSSGSSESTGSSGSSESTGSSESSVSTGSSESTGSNSVSQPSYTVLYMTKSQIENIGITLRTTEQLIGNYTRLQGNDGKEYHFYYSSTNSCYLYKGVGYCNSGLSTTTADGVYEAPYSDEGKKICFSLYKKNGVNEIKVIKVVYWNRTPAATKTEDDLGDVIVTLTW